MNGEGPCQRRLSAHAKPQNAQVELLVMLGSGA
jgi:hypothetical protein